MSSVREIFEAMPRAFQKQAAAGLNVVYQFDLSGEGGGKWCVEVQNGELSVTEREHPSPAVTITATATDYVAIAQGKVNRTLAVVTGKMKIKGNMGLALKLQQIFKD
jgi:putative sterol carrier protein